MAKLNNWYRVTRARPCPICKKTDWCMIAMDGTSAVCCRVTDGCKLKRDGTAIEIGGFGAPMGVVHDLTDGAWKDREPQLPPKPKPEPKPDIDWAAMAVEHENGLTVPRVQQLSEELGLSPISLDMSGLGWCGWAWTWPMHNGDGEIIGFRTRKVGGEKRSYPGSSNGLFVPRCEPWGDTLAITEGPTDMAAALELGTFAIGRFNDLGGIDMAEILLARWNWKGRVAVLSDRDSPGWRGANRMADYIAETHDTRLVCVPRGKDVRRWLTAHGATPEELAFVVENTRRRLPAITDTTGQ